MAEQAVHRTNPGDATHIDYDINGTLKDVQSTAAIIDIACYVVI